MRAPAGLRGHRETSVDATEPDTTPAPIIPDRDPTHTPVVPDRDPTHSPILPDPDPTRGPDEQPVSPYDGRPTGHGRWSSSNGLGRRAIERRVLAA